MCLVVSTLVIPTGDTFVYFSSGLVTVTKKQILEL